MTSISPLDITLIIEENGLDTAPPLTVSDPKEKGRKTVVSVRDSHSPEDVSPFALELSVDADRCENKVICAIILISVTCIQTIK